MEKVMLEPKVPGEPGGEDGAKLDPNAQTDAAKTEKGSDSTNTNPDEPKK
jgi:hypothetical protein